MGNLDFSADPKFAWYVVFLAISGLILITLGPIAGRSQKASARIITTLIGLGFLGYAIYLAFIFNGGGYQIFFYAFILPVVISIKFIGGMIAARQGRSAPSLAPQAEVMGDAPTPPAAPPAS